jgi:hypothetical protein
MSTVAIKGRATSRNSIAVMGNSGTVGVGEVETETEPSAKFNVCV